MEKVIISNNSELEKKKTKFKSSGISSLHVVTDFDKTLTKAFNKKEKVGTAIAQIRNNNYLSTEYTKKAFGLFNHYHLIETDPNLTIDKKIHFMEEWWSKHLGLIVSSGMKKEIVEDIVNKEFILAREGLGEFLSFLNKYEVPVLILSSALGDVIDGFLKKKNLLSDNMHIISNYFNFDENGLAKGYKGKIVHVFNKDESQVKNTPYFERISKRKNVLLLGDSLGDLKMTGQIGFDEIIKIGFLNENVEQNLEEYKKHFDVIILNDGSLEFVNNLLKELFD